MTPTHLQLLRELPEAGFGCTPAEPEKSIPMFQVTLTKQSEEKNQEVLDMVMRVLEAEGDKAKEHSSGTSQAYAFLTHDKFQVNVVFVPEKDMNSARAAFGIAGLASRALFGSPVNPADILHVSEDPTGAPNLLITKGTKTDNGVAHKTVTCVDITVPMPRTITDNESKAYTLSFADVERIGGRPVFDNQTWKLTWPCVEWFEFCAAAPVRVSKGTEVVVETTLLPREREELERDRFAKPLQPITKMGVIRSICNDDVLNRLWCNISVAFVPASKCATGHKCIFFDTEKQKYRNVSAIGNVCHDHGGPHTRDVQILPVFGTNEGQLVDPYKVDPWQEVDLFQNEGQILMDKVGQDNYPTYGMFNRDLMCFLKNRQIEGPLHGQQGGGNSSVCLSPGSLHAGSIGIGIAIGIGISAVLAAAGGAVYWLALFIRKKNTEARPTEEGPPQA